MGKTRKKRAREKLAGREKGKRKGERACNNFFYNPLPPTFGTFEIIRFRLSNCWNVRQVFCSFLSAPMCGKSRKHSFNTVKLSWIPLFHARGRRTPSLWVTGTTRFGNVDIICQIWPIRGYTRSWYTGTGRLKKWLQAPSPLLSPVSFRFIFVFVLPRFSGPDYLGAWNRLLGMKPPQRFLPVGESALGTNQISGFGNSSRFYN